MKVSDWIAEFLADQGCTHVFGVSGGMCLHLVHAVDDCPRLTGVWPHHEQAAAMAAEDPIWKSIYPHTPQQFNDLRYYPYDFYATRWDELIDRWERTVLRAG